MQTLWQRRDICRHSQERVGLEGVRSGEEVARVVVYFASGSGSHMFGKPVRSRQASSDPSGASMIVADIAFELYPLTIST